MDGFKYHLPGDSLLSGHTEALFIPPKCQALVCLSATVHSVSLSLECLSLLLYLEKSSLSCKTQIINPPERLFLHPSCSYAH